MTATATLTTTTTLAALEAEWTEAVRDRQAHDARVARVLTTIDPLNARALELARRREGARRAHLTRRIVRAERALDALR